MLQIIDPIQSFTINQIVVTTHANDLGGKVWNPAIHWHVKYAVFIALKDDDGRVGIGECWCFDSAPDALLAFIRTEVCHLLINQPINEVLESLRRLQQRTTLTARHGMLASALSGVDMAVWDLLAQRQNIPLWQALNPDGSGVASLYRSGGLYGRRKTTQDLVDELCGFVAHGYDLVKMKIGGLDKSKDLERVQRVLEALPSQVRLIIDGVYSYAVADALDFYESIVSDRIEAFQSPVAAHDIPGMRFLTEQGVPVMATEAEYRREIHTLLIQQRAVRFLQVSPIACGGPSRVLELSRDLGSTDIRLSLEVSSTAIAKLIGAHLAAACKTIAHTESHAVHTVYDEHLNHAMKVHGSHWQLPRTPGLGLDLPADDNQTTIAFRFPDNTQRTYKRNTHDRQS